MFKIPPVDEISQLRSLHSKGELTFKYRHNVETQCMCVLKHQINDLALLEILSFERDIFHSVKNDGLSVRFPIMHI